MKTELQIARPVGRSWGSRRWLLALVAFGLLERTLFWLAYAPARFGDTPSYFRLASALLEGGLSGYDATRVPGYPGFLALLGMDPQVTWLAQMTLGLLLSLLLFVIGLKITGSPAFGFVAGMSYSLLPGPMLFEANLLSETLTATLVTLSLTLWVLLERASDRGPHALACLAGAAAALAGMVRPLFFLLPVWLLLFVWFRSGAAVRRRLSLAAAFSLAPLLILGGWLSWVHRTYGVLAPTTMGGYHLVQHTGEYFEYLPDEHADLRDTYLRYRDARIAERGTQTNAIWDAIPELTEVSGLSFFALSAELQRLSLQLIFEHPELYVRNVIQGWIDFWKAPVYWDQGAIDLAPLRTALGIWTLAGRGLTLLINAAFLVGSLAVALSRRFRHRLALSRFSLAAGGFVWLSSVAQTLVDHGDNPRFLVPLQPLVAVLVLAALRSIWAGIRDRPAS